MRNLWVVGAVFSISCFAQRVEIGVKAGIPLSNTFETGSFFTLGFGEGAASATRRYAVGPTIQVRAFGRWSVEFEAIYKRLGYDLTTKQTGVYYVDTRATANSWEFPIIAKFRLGNVGGWTPFVGGGASFRATVGASGTSLASYPYVSNIPVPFNSSHLSTRSHHGGVAVGGVERRFGRLHLAPEIRYTRWAVDSPEDNLFYSQPNQVDFLVGFRF